MLDWLAIWGVSQAVGILVYPILQDLAKEGAEDFAKDFFKDSLKHVLLREKDPRLVAAGKAIKEFLQLVQQQLKFRCKLPDAEIKQYIQEVKKFIRNQSVKEILGKGFDANCESLDARTLEQTWNSLQLKPMPPNFNWGSLTDQYLMKVQEILCESEDLRSILDSQNLEAIQRNTTELAGIVPEFDLERYQEGLQERYSNLNLDSLDTSVYDYREKLKVWQVFVAQNVRECQEFLPQVYEIPKEHQKRLRESNQLEAEIDPEEWKRYKQIYYQQPVRSVLDVVNDMQSDRLPPQPPLVRGEQDFSAISSLVKGEQDFSAVPPLVRGEQAFLPVPPLSKGGLGGVNSCRYIVILGDPGSGKSTLLQYLALNWARTPLNNVISQPIPLLIELRSYIRDRNSGQCKNFLEFFHKGSVICRLNQHELHERLKAGKVLVLFDGLDEVFDPAQREEVITDIHRFTNDYPNVRVIVTSRIIGYKPQRLRDAEFRHFLLQDLESDQIQDFIDRWHELTFTDEADKVRKRERLQQAIKTSSAIGELAGNPLLLTMMAILNRNQELPRDRPELYNQASRVLLHQWDVEQKLLENPRIDSVAIDYKDKQAILRQVAYHMQAADKGLAGNLIRGEDLEKILIGYLKSIEVSQPRTVARLLIEQLRSRNFILCFLGADSYGFVHRTFLEYFCACEFVERFGKRGLEGGLTLEELKVEVFGKHWQDESWHEVLRLIVGMIDTSFAGQIIEYMITLNGEADKFINLFLAAECLSEIRNRSSINAADIHLARRIKELINYGEVTSTPLFVEERELVDGIRSQAVSVIATIWKDNPETLPWLKTCAQSNDGLRTRTAAVQAVIDGWKDDPETLQWLKTLAQFPKISWWLVQQTVVQGIARGWKDDPETLQWLKTWIQADGNKSDRFTQAAAVEELVRGWKGDPETLPMLKTCIQCDDRSDVARRTALEELARGWKDNPDTLPLLKAYTQSDKDWFVREGGLEELAEGWKDDPDVLPILKTRVQSDDHWRVRSTALEELARNWKDDPETLPFLKKCAASDDTGNARAAAVRELARGWKDDPETLPLLKTRALSDDHEYVRRAAVRELARGWKDDPETLPLLKTRALSDDHEYVRGVAVKELVKGWKDEPWMFVFLCDRALNDPFERKEDREDNPRQLALEIIIKQYPDHPQTLPLCKDRAENDPDEKVREFAKKKLAELEK
jgi:predicted NACHT family NTPase